MSACIAYVAFDTHPRHEFLKKRFAGIILKSQQTLGLVGTGSGSDKAAAAAAARCCVKEGAASDKMRKKRNELELRRKEQRRYEEIQKKREAARREIEQMSNTCAFEDHDQVLRDFEKLIGHDGAANRHPSLTQYGSNSLLFEYVDSTKLKWGAHCWDAYLESLGQNKSSLTGSHVENAVRAKEPEVADELEEGEIIE